MSALKVTKQDSQIVIEYGPATEKNPDAPHFDVTDEGDEPEDIASQIAENLDEGIGKQE